MSSSLGYRQGGEIAQPARTAKTVRTVTIEPETPDAYCSVCGVKLTCPVPQGMLMILLLFAGAIGVPLTYFYGSVDYTLDWTPPLITGLSALAALLVLVFGSNMPIAYNVVLGLYTGVEVRVIDLAFAYAAADGTTDEASALAIAAAVTIIVHLVPFYLSDSGLLVTTLAAVGIVVNAATCAYIDSSIALQTFTSGTAFLLTTLIILGVHCVPCSMLTMFKDAIVYKRFLVMEPLALKL